MTDLVVVALDHRKPQSFHGAHGRLVSDTRSDGLKKTRLAKLWIALIQRSQGASRPCFNQRLISVGAHSESFLPFQKKLLACLVKFGGCGASFGDFTGSSGRRVVCSWGVDPPQLWYFGAVSLEFAQGVGRPQLERLGERQFETCAPFAAKSGTHLLI